MWFIILLGMAGLAFLVSACIFEVKEYRGGIAFLVCIGTTLLVWSIFAAIALYTPSAIDVYQGKTTLKITYEDGVPVDSTVVFKNK